MEFHLLKTFATVAREGSITRASERLSLSQPAVSAHIKAIEEHLDVTLFERTPRGMSLTGCGRRILAKAESALDSHRDLVDEARRLTGQLSGKLRIGIGGRSGAESLEYLVRRLSAGHPEVEISLEHCSSGAALQGIRSGAYDAGFYNETHAPEDDLVTREVARFPVYVTARAGMVDRHSPLDWQALAGLPWILAPDSLCGGGAAERLFSLRGFRPSRVISIDRQCVTRAMVAAGLGIGLLHGGMAIEAQRLGEVDILCIAHAGIRNVFAHLVTRVREPMFVAIAAMLDDAPPAVQADVLHANVQEPRARAPSSAYLMSAFRKHK